MQPASWEHSLHVDVRHQAALSEARPTREPLAASVSHYRSRPCEPQEHGPAPSQAPTLARQRAGHPAAIDTMRARIVKAAEAWDALATHAAKQAGECRHGAELADRTRRRWAHSV